MAKFGENTQQTIDELIDTLATLKTVDPTIVSEVSTYLAQANSEFKTVEKAVEAEVDWDNDPDLPDPNNM